MSNRSSGIEKRKTVHVEDVVVKDEEGEGVMDVGTGTGMLANVLRTVFNILFECVGLSTLACICVCVGPSVTFATYVPISRSMAYEASTAQHMPLMDPADTADDDRFITIVGKPKRVEACAATFDSTLSCESGAFSFFSFSFSLSLSRTIIKPICLFTTVSMLLVVFVGVLLMGALGS